MIRSLVLLVGLMALGVEDLWKKQISSLPLILMAVAGGVFSVVTGDWKDWMVILRFLPGGITLLLAWLTKESRLRAVDMAIDNFVHYLNGIPTSVIN